MNLPRLYTDLAWLWPLWESLEDYRAECDFYSRCIQKHSRIDARTLLDLGCGGGKTACHLKRRFRLTGIDLSEAMLSQARELNPECEFLKGDMRTVELGRLFDAVYVNDAISYAARPQELSAVFRTAWRHLRPGGVMLVGPDRTVETFVQDETQVSPGQAENPRLTFIEYIHDRDPSDTFYEMVLIVLIREEDKLRIEHDVHLLGLFPKSTWRDLMAEAGFECHEEAYPAGVPGAVPGSLLFVGTKPLGLPQG